MLTHLIVHCSSLEGRYRHAVLADALSAVDYQSMACLPLKSGAS